MTEPFYTTKAARDALLARFTTMSSADIGTVRALCKACDTLEARIAALEKKLQESQTHDYAQGEYPTPGYDD